MSSKNTPVAVTVARWSALAAGVTALGSILNTMWTEAPWWVQRADAAKVSPEIKMMAADEVMPMMAMSAPAPSFYDVAMAKISTSPIAVTLVAVSALVIVGSLVMEYHHRKHHRNED